MLQENKVAFDYNNYLTIEALEDAFSLPYAALLPLNCILSPALTVIVGADSPVLEVIDTQL